MGFNSLNNKKVKLDKDKSSLCYCQICYDVVYGNTCLSFICNNLVFLFQVKGHQLRSIFRVTSIGGLFFLQEKINENLIGDSVFDCFSYSWVLVFFNVLYFLLGNIR